VPAELSFSANTNSNIEAKVKQNNDDCKVSCATSYIHSLYTEKITEAYDL